ncbi:hypothetical protein BGX34_009560 [Mortierella sp. NVP85]|nr:hypothetical protein BGX34_009560 [Mortierella sp. NVP85]
MDERTTTADTVHCGICHLQGSTSYTCVPCVRPTHWDELKIVAAERDQLATQANQVFSPKIKRYQMYIAQRTTASGQIAAIGRERELLLVDLEQDRQNLIRLRTALNQRKETLKLSMARFKVAEMNSSPPINKSISRIMDRWAVAHQKLGHSRRVLVAELVTLFDLKCVPERRRNSANYDLGQSTISTATTLTVGSTNTKEGTRRKLRVRDYLEEDSWNEYLIVGRPLPTGYFENYDRDAINTTIENVVHMMTLVACYLGIKLPFDTFRRQSRYYIYIQAAFTAGSKRAPLFLSESNIMPFATGLAHLNYNIAYLCHSQGIQITLANATNTLENLLACCEAPNLGRYTNYASIVTKRPEDATEAGNTMEEATPLSVSDDSNFRKPVEVNEDLLWCPGQEPFDLNLHDLITVIRSRREEESPVWGGLLLQDAVAANVDTLEEDYFMYDDQEEEDGMFTLEAAGAVHPLGSEKPGNGSGTDPAIPNPGTSSRPKGDLLNSNQRRPAHPSRDRQQSSSYSNHSPMQSSDPDGSLTANQGQPENWTFLDVDTFRVPSSVNNGSGLLGRGWPDMSMLRKVGSAVGGAAAGLVNGATGSGSGRNPRLDPGSRNHSDLLP